MVTGDDRLDAGFIADFIMSSKLTWTHEVVGLHATETAVMASLGERIAYMFEGDVQKARVSSRRCKDLMGIRHLLPATTETAPDDDTDIVAHEPARFQHRFERCNTLRLCRQQDQLRTGASCPGTFWL